MIMAAVYSITVDDRCGVGSGRWRVSRAEWVVNQTAYTPARRDNRTPERPPRSTPNVGHFPLPQTLATLKSPSQIWGTKPCRELQ